MTTHQKQGTQDVCLFSCLAESKDALSGGWCNFGELFTAALVHFRQKLPAAEKICAMSWYYQSKNSRPGLIVVTERVDFERP